MNGNGRFLKREEAIDLTPETEIEIREHRGNRSIGQRVLTVAALQAIYTVSFHNAMMVYGER